ncbi:hypothetical protein F5X98DRAFT_352824, partial [Xylaria grammica]
MPWMTTLQSLQSSLQSSLLLLLLLLLLPPPPEIVTNTDQYLFPSSHSDCILLVLCFVLVSPTPTYKVTSIQEARQLGCIQLV